MAKHHKNINIIISGGGTGGHIFPALAIANELKKRKPQANILFVGAKNRMEMEKVPAHGYPITGLWISGINRRQKWRNWSFPLKLISSILKAKKLIHDFKPDVVIGTGGFASGPVLLAAQQKNIPTFIQEQNSYPGITNKLLSKKALKIYTAYDNLTRFFDVQKIVKTGNPVREDLHNINLNTTDSRQFFGLNPNKKTILSLGGSLGAHPINEAVKKILPALKEEDYQIIWQTGPNDYNTYKQLSNDTIKVVPFIKDMAKAYAAADLIISRAGAGTISELAIIGKPVILVPSPYVAEDHQTKNAKALAQKKAAVLIHEKDLSQQLWTEIKTVFNSSEKANELSKNIKEIAKPEATKQIVDDILTTISK